VAGSTILYLTKADVLECLPPVERRLELADYAMASLANGNCLMPPKPELMTRVEPEGAFHALPAFFRDRDIAGCKWSCTFAANPPRGLPSVSALIILSDPDTGFPLCVMDGTLVTAHRTAAVSGVSIKRMAPRRVGKVAIWGAGFQARTHLEVLCATIPGFPLWVYDSDAARLEDYAAWAGEQAGVSEVHKGGSVAETLQGADVAITATTVHNPGDPYVVPGMLGTDCLLLPLEWNLQVPASTAKEASLFLVDDRAEFTYYRDQADRLAMVAFKDYPDPHETIGEAVARCLSRETRPDGLIVSCALGTGAADVSAASEVYQNARKRAVGTTLAL